MQDCNQDDMRVVTTTVASMAQATALARGLVEARLAACVQLDPLAGSFYRWEGRLCEDAEVRLTIKTTAARLGEIEAFFSGHHPYELPQFVVFACGASAPYAGWVRSETA